MSELQAAVRDLSSKGRPPIQSWEAFRIPVGANHIDEMQRPQSVLSPSERSMKRSKTAPTTCWCECVLVPPGRAVHSSRRRILQEELEVVLDLLLENLISNVEDNNVKICQVTYAPMKPSVRSLDSWAMHVIRAAQWCGCICRS